MHRVTAVTYQHHYVYCNNSGQQPLDLKYMHRVLRDRLASDGVWGFWKMAMLIPYVIPGTAILSFLNTSVRNTQYGRTLLRTK